MLSIVDAVSITQPDLRRLGEHLRALRRAAGETQEQTASAAGLTRTHLTGIEAGRKNITLGTLYSLANHFGVEPADLLAGPEISDGRPAGA